MESKTVRRGLTRRRLMVTSAGTALGASLLAACGGNGDKQQVSSLLNTPKDTSSSAKRGGTHLVRRNDEPATYDAQQRLGGSIGTQAIFSRLLRQKPGHLERAPLEFVGDLAESWEFSPDRLQLTMRLRQNAKWHNLPPVRGRAVDGEDIAASWNRFEGIGATRANFSTKINADAPIESVRAVDARTAVIKLNQPLSVILGLLSTRDAGMYFFPKEADSGYDARRVAIGSGPWMVQEHVPSARIEYVRHEGYYDAHRLHFDKVTEFIISEYSNLLAQFRNGSILEMQAVGSNPDLRQEDALPTKKAIPQLVLTVRDPAAQYGMMKFGWNPALGDRTPFRDKRLRQALAMSIDRELILDGIYNVDGFAKEGIPLRGFLHTAVLSDTGGDYWLNPRGKEFGQNVKYYQHNVAEAKKLVAAAGHPNGLETVANYPGPPAHGDVFNRHIPIILEMAREGGINLRSNVVGFLTDYRPQFFFNQGDFAGLLFQFRPASGIFDPVEVAFLEFTPNAGAYCGLFSENSTYMNGDPEITTLLKKARVEFDEKRRINLMHDFQRLEAVNQYRPSLPGTAESLGLHWPAVQNVNVNRMDIIHTGLWLDRTKPPFGSG